MTEDTETFHSEYLFNMKVHNFANTEENFENKKLCKIFVEFRDETKKTDLHTNRFTAIIMIETVIMFILLSM